jgi:uncharacterized membrane protein
LKPSGKNKMLKNHHYLPTLLLWLLIAAYALYFSWYSLNRHNTLNSYAADLSLIDQPMWNTIHGRFMELTWGDRQQPRLAEHFEPILLPLALLFFVWDDVRILLIAQSLALALGALPVFWLARARLASPWVGLAFATAYLLSPHLQAANIADLHADPFAVAPFLLACWYATQKRWRWMWFWAVVVMATKETLPTLPAMLGVWLVALSLALTPGPSPFGRGESGSCSLSLWERARVRVHGLALIGVSAAWFLVATFGIVAPLARQYFGTDGPIYFANRYNGGLAGLLDEPARWWYGVGLLAAVGWLPLLSPTTLILGLPVLVANLLSNFAGQYSGEQHYSAPLAPSFLIAAIYGAGRLVDYAATRGQAIKTHVLIGACLWLLAWSLGYHARHGWTPFSLRTESYPMTPAALLLPGLAAQIPPDAVVSASAGLHPHVAHRRVIYIFPTVQEADYLLVDVTDIPGTHPNDARTQIMELLAGGDWQLLAAEHGLILAQRVAPQSPVSLPRPFFDFARAAGPPTYLTALAFGDGRLRLLGYDFHDDPDNGITFRLYWQNAGTLPDNLRLWPLVYDDQGRLLNDPPATPMIAALWYPPAAWQEGEVVVTETLPQLLPDTFHLGVAVGFEDDFGNYWPVTAEPSPPAPFLRWSGGEGSLLQPGRWAQLATFRRQGLLLIRRPPALTLLPLTTTNITFGPAIRLTGFWIGEAEAGAELPVLLRWEADEPPHKDFTVFIHLLDADGRRVAQSDAFPTWLTPQPTTAWPLNQPVLDGHRIPLPPGLPAGSYTLQVGLYDAHTLERLPPPGQEDAWRMGQIWLE